jgi:hypothetical protein
VYSGSHSTAVKLQNQLIPKIAFSDNSAVTEIMDERFFILIKVDIELK